MAERPRVLSYVDARSGIRFVFMTEPTDPKMLHIYARSLTTVYDAVETFFEGQTRWNAEQERLETFTDRFGLYWFWLEVDQVVVVISCFRREGA